MLNSAMSIIKATKIVQILKKLFYTLKDINLKQVEQCEVI